MMESNKENPNFKNEFESRFSSVKVRNTLRNRKIIHVAAVNFQSILFAICNPFRLTNFRDFYQNEM